MENITNIGPILDMSVTDLDKQGRDVVSKERKECELVSLLLASLLLRSR